MGGVLILFSIGYYFNGRAWAPFQLIQAATIMPFMLLGFQAKKIKIPVAKHVDSLVISFIGFVFVFYLSQFDRPLNLVSNTLQQNPLLFIVCGVMGIGSLFFLSISIGGWLSKILVFFGLESMILMGIHQEIRVLSGYLIQSFIYLSPVELLIVNLISIILLSVPIILFLNTFLPFFVGKE